MTIPVQIGDPQHLFHLGQHFRHGGRSDAERSFEPGNGRIHLSPIRVDLRRAEMQRDGIGTRVADVVGGCGQFLRACLQIGERLLPQRAGQARIGIPSGGFGIVRESRAGFDETGDVHVETDAAFGAQGILAGTTGLVDSGEFVPRQHLDDREAGGKPEHRRNLTGGEPSKRVADLLAQCGGIESAQQAAIERCGIHGFLASKHGEIGALLEFRPRASHLPGGVQNEDPQRDSSGIRFLARSEEDNSRQKTEEYGKQRYSQSSAMVSQSETAASRKPRAKISRMESVAVSGSTSLRSITKQQWITVFAAQAGYMLDAMDVLLFVFAVNVLRDEFHLSATQAGLASSFTLAFSAIGGIAFGVLSDRIGRARALIWSILIYSFASAGTALSWNLASLLFWRAMIGIGLGAEWSAGAVLVAETWPAEHRAKAVGIMQSGWALGYLLAAGVTALVLPRWGWKVLFLTGLLPAILALALRNQLEEPEIWKQSLKRPRVSPVEIFRGELLGRTVLASALATSVLFAYWGLFTWIPGFLSASPARGGAGLSIVRTSAFIVPMQIGAFAGYVGFGWLSDRIGRRFAFLIYVVGAAIATPIYGASHEERTLLILGPVIGFLGTGFFSLFGAMLAELYPTALRGAGQGFVYNIGRGLSSLAPWVVGFCADRYGIGASLALNSAFFLLGAALIFTLPETKKVALR